MPWGDSSHVTRDLLTHLRLRHRFEYAVVADFEADEEAMLRRALAVSAQELGVDEEADLQRILRESAMEAAMQADNEDDEEEEEEEECRGAPGTAEGAGMRASNCTEHGTGAEYDEEVDSEVEVDDESAYTQMREKCSARSDEEMAERNGSATSSRSQVESPMRRCGTWAGISDETSSPKKVAA